MKMSKTTLKLSKHKLTQKKHKLAVVGAITHINSLQPYNYHKIISDLVVKLQNDKNLLQLLEKSLKKANKQINSKKQNKVKSVKEYLLFLNNYINNTPDQLSQIVSADGNVSKQSMLDGICYFYFLIDQPLPELSNLGFFKNSLQYYPIFQSWLLQYVDVWGDFLDSEQSWNNLYYDKIVASGEFNMESGWFSKGNIWRTFNDWFSRILVCPAKSHPIAYINDDSIVISPADSVPQGVWKLNSDGKIKKKMKIKLINYTHIKELLRYSEYLDSFKNGTLTHTFLNVNDYHRYHYAVAGEVIEHNTITHGVTLSVTWDRKQKKFVPNDSLGWQYKQTHSYVIIKTKKYGLVALIPMGMAQVSSCNLTYPVLRYHNKGDGLGTFRFGGSDFIMIFQSKVTFTMTAPKNSNGSYKHILMGEKYGTLSI